MLKIYLIYTNSLYFRANKLQFMRGFGYYRLSDRRQLNKRRRSLGAVNVLTKAALGQLLLGGWNLGKGSELLLCDLCCSRLKAGVNNGRGWIFTPFKRPRCLTTATSTSSRRFYRSPSGNKREITFHPRSPLRGISLNFLSSPAAANSQIGTYDSAPVRIF